MLSPNSVKEISSHASWIRCKVWKSQSAPSNRRWVGTVMGRPSAGSRGAGKDRETLEKFRCARKPCASTAVLHHCTSDGTATTALTLTYRTHCPKPRQPPDKQKTGRRAGSSL